MGEHRRAGRPSPYPLPKGARARRRRRRAGLLPAGEKVPEGRMRGRSGPALLIKVPSYGRAPAGRAPLTLPSPQRGEGEKAQTARGPSPRWGEGARRADEGSVRARTLDQSTLIWASTGGPGAPHPTLSPKGRGREGADGARAFSPLGRRCPKGG